MALHLVGLGLHDVRDVTVKGLERIRACDAVYAEFYTAILTGTTHAELEAFLERPVRLLDRLGVEKGAAALVAEAKDADVALLTAGDPLAATTHTDLMVRCHAAGVAFHVVHAPSIYSAAPGLLGLQHYKFGRTTTLVRPEPGWSPTSPFEAVAENHARGLHTLVLLDIKADEGYFMTANEGLALLAELARRTGADWFGDATEVGVVARAGSAAPVRLTGPVHRLARHPFGKPLHCIVVPGSLQVVEQEAWDLLRLPDASGRRVARPARLPPGPVAGGRPARRQAGASDRRRSSAAPAIVTACGGARWRPGPCLPRASPSRGQVPPWTRRRRPCTSWPAPCCWLRPARR